MKTELKDVIHLLMGCEVITDSGTRGRLVTLNIKDSIGVIQINDAGQTISKLIAEFKPIQRRLSSMTEEEALDLAKIYSGCPNTSSASMNSTY